MKSILFTIFTLFLFTGCSYTTYDYITPNTKEAFQCVYNCDYEKKQCLAKVAEEQKKLDFVYYLKRSKYNQCQAHNDPKLIKEKADNYIFRCMRHNSREVCEKQFYLQHKPRKCNMPYREIASRYTCDKNYDSCFKSCGGKIVPVEKELF